MFPKTREAFGAAAEIVLWFWRLVRRKRRSRSRVRR